MIRRHAAAVAVLVSLAVASGVAAQDDARTPAERAIAQAMAAIDKAPASSKGRVALAFAYARRARETSDPAFYERGNEAVRVVLEKDPDDLEARKAQAWLFLGQHRFADARDAASALNKKVPDDVMVYGLLVDAFAELGDYDAAEKSAQWMLNLRPANVPALARTAYLRELFGDPEGALELMGMALDQTPLGEAEERAWILTQMGHLELSRGDLETAEARLSEALLAFPEYHYALGQMAKVRTAQGQLGEALALERRHYAGAPHPENLYLLAGALERAGESAKAQSAFAAFEKGARAEMEGPDNANRELVFYYLDHKQEPVEGLRIAEREARIRQDVFTRHALAWALHRNGRSAEARVEIEKALAVGIKDAEIARHARLIAETTAP